MPTFNDREKSFENKFAHDQEVQFKITARRNKLLGLWASEKLGFEGQTSEDYAKAVVVSDLEKAGDSDLVQKILEDFQKAGLTITEREIREEMNRLLGVARKQVQGE